LGKGDWRWALGAGLALALAHYTKASTLPALGIFTGVALLKVGKGIWRRGSETGRVSIRTQLVNLILVILLYLAVLSPYLLESRRIFGHAFYNVNTTFYAWYDDFSEAKEGTQAAGDRLGWPDLPEDEIPSPAKYLREHSTAQVIERMRRGLLNQAGNWIDTFAALSYPLLISFLLGILAWSWRAQLREWLQGRSFQLLFVVLYLGGYSLLFAWYGSVTGYADQRLTYALTLPLLFAAFVTFEGVGARVREFTGGGLSGDGRTWLNRAYAILLAVLSVDILFHVPAALNYFDWYGK
jgi:hypothetical protein